MDIALYISTILQEQDEVGIPGMGTFYKKKAAARFDSQSKKFYPPGVQISFREDQPTDKSLSEFISKTKNLSQPSAEYFAEKFGAELMKQLQASETIELSGLGSLYNSDAGIAFNAKAASFSTNGFGLVAVEEPQYVPSSNSDIQVDVLPVAQQFGEEHEPQESTVELVEETPIELVQPQAIDLVEETEVIPQTESEATSVPAEVQEVEAEPLLEENDGIKSEPVTEDSPVDIAEENTVEDLHISPEPVEPDAPVIKEPEVRPSANIFDYSIPLEKDYAGDVNLLEPTEEIYQEEIDDRNKRSWLRFLIAAVLVAAITFAGFYYRDTLNSFFLKPDIKKTVTKRIVPVIQPDTLAQDIETADSTFNALKQAGLNPEKPQDTANITTKPNEIRAPGSIKSYDIIGPSLTAKQAEAYIKQMRVKGIYAYVMPNLPGPLLKIGLGTFNNREAAANELLRIQKDVYADAYILEIKNK